MLKLRVSVGLRGLIVVPPAAELLLLGPAEVVGLFTLPEEPGRCPLLLRDLGTWILSPLCDDFDPVLPL